jgi:hypothetical protein
LWISLFATNARRHERGRAIDSVVDKGRFGRHWDASQWRYEGAPMIMRLDAAKIAAPLVHPKPRARVVIERAERLDFLLLVMRKARWLTNVIVDHGTMKTFDLAGIAPDGIPYDIHITTARRRAARFPAVGDAIRGRAVDHASRRGQDCRAVDIGETASAGGGGVGATINPCRWRLRRCGRQERMTAPTLSR